MTPEQIAKDRQTIAAATSDGWLLPLSDGRYPLHIAKECWPAALDEIERLRPFEESFKWVLHKIRTTWNGYKPPTDGRNDDNDVKGSMQVLVAHAHGYEAYIAAFKCDDKEGEIGRQHVEIERLQKEVAVLRSQLNIANNTNPTLEENQAVWDEVERLRGLLKIIANEIDKWDGSGAGAAYGVSSRIKTVIRRTTL